MASMAAAIAAARTAALTGNRPLDERERKRFTYFSSLSPMARKIMQDKERIRERYGPEWEWMAPREQDEAVDKCLIDPQLQARYALHRGGGDVHNPGEQPAPRAPPGQKVVHFGEEDIIWQDEHSSPFSWETRSQMDFSIASVPAQEQGSIPWQIEQKQPAKSQAPKGSHVQPSKPTQVSKTPSTDGLGPARKEEESPFWKISAERSRVEGEQAEFQSLTPSQIKSLEKGEKALLSYCRQESGPKERETPKPEKSNMHKQEKNVSLSTASEAAEWKKSRSSLSSIRTLDEVFLPETAPQKPAAAETLGGDDAVKDKAFPLEQQMFAQVNTNNVVLKTGFDFLDNW